MAGLFITVLAIPWTVLAHSTPTAAKLTSVRAGDHQTYTRIVIDLSKPTKYKIWVSESGKELRVTLLNTVPAAGVPDRKHLKSPHATTVRITRPSPTTTRATIRLNGDTRHRIFTLEHPDRVVLDLYTRSDSTRTTPSSTAPSSSTHVRKTTRHIGKMIVIDPGHGGKDPGAMGRTGLKEKTVVLDIGRRLKKLLEQRGHRVIMTRTTDRFISLEDRTKLANAAKADLFISIHANASPVRSVKGVEVYMLGKATNEAARATAARENGPMDAQMSDLDLIFRDMEQDYRVNHSISLAHLTRDAFLRTVGRRYGLVDLGVKRAPFYVLKTATMPGILAEVSFISNAKEEARLKQPSFRQNVAEALEEGIQQYLVAASIQS